MVQHIFEVRAEVGPEGVSFFLGDEKNIALDADGMLFDMDEKECSPALRNDRAVIQEMIEDQLGI